MKLIIIMLFLPPPYHDRFQYVKLGYEDINAKYKTEKKDYHCNSI